MFQDAGLSLDNDFQAQEEFGDTAYNTGHQLRTEACSLTIQPAVPVALKYFGVFLIKNIAVYMQLLAALI